MWMRAARISAITTGSASIVTIVTRAAGSAGTVLEGFEWGGRGLRLPAGAPLACCGRAVWPGVAPPGLGAFGPPARPRNWDSIIWKFWPRPDMTKPESPS